MPDQTRDEWLNLPEPDGSPELRLYLARPANRSPAPTVIVIHEAFGLDEHIQDVTRRLAADGFVAVAPDLFSLDPFGREVSPDEIKRVFALRSTLPPERRRDPAALEEALDRLPATEAERLRQVVAWSSRRDLGAYVAPLARLGAWARARDDTTDAVGITGFCLGGGVVLRVAFAGADLNAAAPFYGQNPPLDQVRNVHCPLLLMNGRRDPFIMPGVPALLAAIQEADLAYGCHVYEEAGHAFLNDTRPDFYNAAAARDAWPLLLAFFHRHLD